MMTAINFTSEQLLHRLIFVYIYKNMQQTNLGYVNCAFKSRNLRFWDPTLIAEGWNIW